jgi:Asp-tRNA(Asn)/Glu-tRNA(Gln) amidotransferase A subunit family amidase
MIFTETDNPLYGRTNNPWDLERSCGGSSGGEGAVIAAGASPLGLGNDIGGSLRVPAAFCGISSIRPTAGRTPDYCAHGLPVGQTGIVSQVGPMARYVEDLVVGLRVLDRARDPFVIPGPELGDPGAVDISRLRFATFADDGEFSVAPAARRAVAEAAQFLIAAGAKEVAWKAPPLSRATDLLFASLRKRARRKAAIASMVCQYSSTLPDAKRRKFLAERGWPKASRADAATRRNHDGSPPANSSGRTRRSMRLPRNSRRKLAVRSYPARPPL